MWQDWLNGTFELLGGLFILLSCVKLYRDKKVRGVSPVAIGYFTLWGWWNCHYYPHLGQWTSFIGGLSTAIVNTTWILMMIYYIRKGRHDKNSLL